MFQTQATIQDSPAQDNDEFIQFDFKDEAEENLFSDNKSFSEEKSFHDNKSPSDDKVFIHDKTVSKTYTTAAGGGAKIATYYDKTEISKVRLH